MRENGIKIIILILIGICVLCVGLSTICITNINNNLTINMTSSNNTTQNTTNNSTYQDNNTNTSENNMEINSEKTKKEDKTNENKEQINLEEQEVGGPNSPYWEYERTDEEGKEYYKMHGSSSDSPRMIHNPNVKIV